MAKFKVGDKVWFENDNTHYKSKWVIITEIDEGYSPLIYQISDINGNPLGGTREEYLSQPQLKDTKQELDPYTFKIIAKQWNRYVKNVTDGKSDCGVVLNSFNAYLNGINAILQVIPDDE